MMSTIVRRYISHIVALSFLLPILFFAVDGCKKESSSPTSPAEVTWPSVAGTWLGGAHQTVPANVTFTLAANFVQKQDSFGGNWLWTNPNGGKTKCWLKARIDQYRRVFLQETSYVRQNWTGFWYITSYTARLNTGGDTISGGWVDSTSMGVIKDSGTIWLAKQ